MWQRKLFVFFIGVTLASAGRAPNADYIEELVQNESFGPRFSDNLLEDARLDVVSIFMSINALHFKFILLWFKKSNKCNLLLQKKTALVIIWFHNY